MFLLLPFYDDRIAEERPFATYAIIALNLLIFFIFTALSGWIGYKKLINTVGFVPANFNPLTLVSCMFFHADFFHVGFNMLFLWIYGPNVEMLMKWWRFLILYFVFGIAASLLQGLVSWGSHDPMIGASGAIAGVMGAYVFLLPQNKVRVLFIMFIIFFIRARVFLVRSFWVIGLWFICQLFYHLLVGATGGVAYAAHIGGFAAGLLIAAALVHTKKLHRSLSEMAKAEDEAAASMQGTTYRTVDQGPSEPPGPPDAPPGPPDAQPADPFYKPTRKYETRAPKADPFYKPTRKYETLAPKADPFYTPPENDPPPGDSEKTSARPAPQPSSPEEYIQANDYIRQALDEADEKGACARYRKILQREGADALDPEIEIRVAGCYMRSGEHALGARAYESVAKKMEQGPRRGYALYMAGIAFSRHVKLYEKARDLLTRAIDEDPEPVRFMEATKELEKINEFLEQRVSGSGETFDHRAPYSVFRQTRTKIDISRVGEIVASITRTPLADVTTLISDSRGIIAREVSGKIAEELTNALQMEGVPVIAIPEENVFVPPSAQVVKAGAFFQAGFRFIISGDMEGMVPWEKVLCINACRIEDRKITMRRDRGTRLLHGAERFDDFLGGGADADVEKMLRKSGSDKSYFLMDVVTRAPVKKFRINTGNFLFKIMPEGRPKTFNALAEDAFSLAGDVYTSENLRIIALGGKAREAYTYDNERHFELNTLWEAQLAMLAGKE